MKQFIAVLIAATLCITAAYAGTFSDNFNDGNLEGWHISRTPETKPPKVERGTVVMDTIIEKNDNPLIPNVVGLMLTAGNAKSWRNYTLTCRVKFSKTLPPLPSFTIFVRMNQGHFIMAKHDMIIHPLEDYIGVTTIPPDAKFNPQKGIEGAIGRGHIKKSIKLNQWYLSKIVAMENHFEFYFDDEVVTVYEDETAVSGTVQFQAWGICSHLDDVVITGPDIRAIFKIENPIAAIWGRVKK